MTVRPRLAAGWLAIALVTSGCGSDQPAAEPAPASSVEVTTTSIDAAPIPQPTATEPAPPTTRDPGKITETTIDVGDLVFDAAVAGPEDGDLVVLLHGFPQTWHQWRHQIETLAAEGYRVLAPNQRGYSAGARPPEVADYALDLVVDDLLGMVDTLGRDTFHLVGHDFGGAAVWLAAVDHPTRVASMTSVSTPHLAALAQALSDPESDQAERSSYFTTFRAEGSEQLFVADDGALLRQLYTQAGLEGDDLEAQLAVLNDVDAMRAALNWYRAGDLGGTELGPVTIPSMYIWSDGDDALGPDAAVATADFVTGPYRFEVIEGVNHWVPEQAADEVSALLVAFLDAQPPL